MNKNTIGFRFDSEEEIWNRDTFIGLDRVKRRLKKIEERVGLTKEGVPTVTGADDTAKLASLLTALQELGLIKTA